MRKLLLTAASVLALFAEPAGAFQVANPYATSLSYDSVHTDRLWAFGDSFTRTNRKPWPNWVEQMTDNLEVGTLKDFAVSGATAGVYSGSTNNFATQVRRWLAASPVFHASDLTVVYLGYNDIDGGLDPTGSDLGNAETQYRTQLQRIVSSSGGGTGGNRRIFVTMVHNWGRSPFYVQNGGTSTMRSRTRVWDGFVARLAAANHNVVAVDLYDALEEVFNNPGKYGFTNITVPDPAHSGSTAFFDDWFHPGQHGQFMIRQVIEYYLTTGWDWSNTTKAPTSAKAKLQADLDAGKVFVRSAASASPGAGVAAATTRAGPPSPFQLQASPDRFGVAWSAGHPAGIR